MPKVNNEILVRLDPNFVIVEDTLEKRLFLGSNFNYLDGGFKSPWSGNYFPSSPARVPLIPGHIRLIEQKCNSMLEQYRLAHYGGGISSAIAWDLSTNDNDLTSGYAIALMILKEADCIPSMRKYLFQSMHVVDVKEIQNNSGGNRSWGVNRNFSLKLISSISFDFFLKETKQSCALWEGDCPRLSGRVSKSLETQTTVIASPAAAGIMAGDSVDSSVMDDNLSSALFQILKENEKVLMGWLEDHATCRMETALSILRPTEEMRGSAVYAAGGAVSDHSVIEDVQIDVGKRKHVGFAGENDNVVSDEVDILK